MLLVSVAGLLIYAWTTHGADPAPTKQDYVGVALDFFNAAAILCLFAILYRSEAQSAKEFGKIMRDNISTVVVALLINLITTAVDIYERF